MTNIIKKRIEWVDVVKFICILLVIADHWEYCPETFINFITPFFLTSFFFVSGYCYKHKCDFKTHLYKKTRSLLIPWLFFSNLNILISGVASIKNHSLPVITELFRNLLQIRGYDDRLWFLPCIFISFIPFYFLVKYIEEKKISQSSGFLIIFLVAYISTLAKYLLKTNGFAYIWGNTNLPWHLEYIGESTMFMFLGYIFKEKYEESLDKYQNFISTTCFILLYLLMFQFRNIVSLYPIRIVYTFILEIVGVLMVVYISKCIKPNRFILFVGSNTLVYFCIQNKVETVLEAIIKVVIPGLYGNVVSNGLLSIAFALLFAVFNAAVLIIPTMLINKYLYKVLGK